MEKEDWKKKSLGQEQKTYLLCWVPENKKGSGTEKTFEEIFRRNDQKHTVFGKKQKCAYQEAKWTPNSKMSTLRHY